MKIDFSENYICKLNQEIKETHYGGAKKQISVHSGVIYFLNEHGKLSCQSFATVSENLRHDAAAVWSHMKLIFEHIRLKFPHIDTVHLQSDGPTTQYKNQSSFFLFYHYCKMFGFKKSTWNFTGAGHGKSEADGAGAVIKQLGDRLVSRGNDVQSVDDLVKHLEGANCKVMIKKYPMNTSRKLRINSKKECRRP